eukprot:COSAG02_NODE_693_length_18428_cov_268.516722_13_plen_83_part_00
MQLSVCNCMYISMSYHYSKYEFLGRGKTGKLQGYRPDLAFCIYPSKPTISRCQTRCAQVGCSARARARPRAREPTGTVLPYV